MVAVLHKACGRREGGWYVKRKDTIVVLSSQTNLAGHVSTQAAKTGKKRKREDEVRNSAALSFFCNETLRS